MTAVSRTSSNECPDLAIGTMCLETFCDEPQSFPADYAALYCYVKGDQPSTMADLIKPFLGNGGSGPRFRVFLYCLAEIFVACRFDRCAQCLLSEVAPRSGIALDHHFLNHFITTTGRIRPLTRHEKTRNNTQWGFGSLKDDSGGDFLIHAIDLFDVSVFQSEDGLKRLP